MHEALFRVALQDGSHALAGGTVAGGPVAVLNGLSLDQLLTLTPAEFWAHVEAAEGTPLPEGAVVVAPIESQDVWGAGVTYVPSRDARKNESQYAGVYEAVYAAARPELFFKSRGTAVRGPAEPIGIRSDSRWDVPEPELALVLTSRHEIAAITIGNDVSSRSIEGTNPLYLPQAKIYDGACALGPCLVRPVSPLPMTLDIERGGSVVFTETASTSQMGRSLDELAAWLGRGRTSPVGVVLLTGTPIVPPEKFTLRAGDVVAISIEGLGVLKNPVETVDAGPVPLDETSRHAGGGGV